MYIVSNGHAPTPMDLNYRERIKAMLMLAKPDLFLSNTSYGAVFKPQWNRRAGLFFGEKKEIVGAALHEMIMNITQTFALDQIVLLERGEEISSDHPMAELFEAIENLLYAIHNKDQPYCSDWLNIVEEEAKFINDSVEEMEPQSCLYSIKVAWNKIYSILSALIIQMGCTGIAIAVGASAPMIVGTGLAGFAVGYACSGFFRPRFSEEERLYGQIKQFVKEVVEAKKLLR